MAQAEILDRMLEKEGTPLKGLICIHVPFEELKRRMLERAKIEGRADDNEEAIAKRFGNIMIKPSTWLIIIRRRSAYRCRRKLSGRGSVQCYYESDRGNEIR
ncbi:MAG: nucleoside monophosphate kinase [Odoribacter splanchnicus]